jgi:DNA-binding NarL/FixJ family response regulator
MDQAPDVVLMDIHLPGLSGQQTAEVIRRMDPDAYVVMISVDTATDTVRTATLNRVGAFLKKPFSKERLHAAIGRSPHVKPVSTAPVTNLNSSWQV